MTGVMIELMVANDLSSPNAATIFRACSDVKTILKTRTLHEAYARNVCAEMARDGIEPPTRGFSVRCSTN
jgi:hypothetical protein